MIGWSVELVVELLSAVLPILESEAVEEGEILDC